jgi:hypothetical protein
MTLLQVVFLEETPRSRNLDLPGISDPQADASGSFLGSLCLRLLFRSLEQRPLCASGSPARFDSSIAP